jgi:hypothetical protein
MKRSFMGMVIAGALLAAAMVLPQQSSAGPVSVQVGIGLPVPAVGYAVPAYYPPAYYGPSPYGPVVVAGPRYGYYGRWHPGYYSRGFRGHPHRW